MQAQMGKMIQGQEDTPIALLMEAMVHEMPLRAILMAGDGPFNRERLEALLLIINGQTFKGFFALLKSVVTK